MLFSSQIFILIFLPAVLLAYYIAAENVSLRTKILIFASLAFYSYWDIRFLPLLVLSISFNWLVAYVYIKKPAPFIIVIGVTLNLLPIIFFKYLNFFGQTFASFIGSAHPEFSLILPLGISFFTFQQISYLVDIRRNRAPLYSFEKYFLYIAFFPQLIAGPIVRHNQLINQLSFSPTRSGLHERLCKGYILFVLGLVKKVFFADQYAHHSDNLFSSFSSSAVIHSTDAWAAGFYYSLQLYFDFSSYSDMAIGLGLMFGFILPVNFNSPYAALNLKSFWRRWHITLSSFLRDYVYIPLGGSRKGSMKHITAVIITMFLCGLWHGAGWTFVIWGLIHAFGLIINHVWSGTGFKIPSFLSWAITMLFVMVGWILFRAEDFTLATKIILSLFSEMDLNQINIDLSLFFFVALGCFISALGPSNIALANRYLYKQRYVPYLFSLLITAVLLKIGPGRSLEFIYFQF